MVRTEGGKAYRPSDLRDSPRVRETKPVKSNGGYKFSKRINMLNDIREYDTLEHLFDNPNKAHKESNRFEGGVIYGEIGGVEARIELTRARPGFLSVKKSEEELRKTYQETLNRLIRR